MNHCQVTYELHAHMARLDADQDLQDAAEALVQEIGEPQISRGAKRLELDELLPSELDELAEWEGWAEYHLAEAHPDVGEVARDLLGSLLPLAAAATSSTAVGACEATPAQGSRGNGAASVRRG